MIEVDLGTVVSLRDYLASDEHFVRDSWVRSYSHSPVARDAGAAYFQEHRRLVSSLIADPKTRILIACVADDHGAICGWAAWRERSTLYYVYVRQTARRIGVARLLLSTLDHGNAVEYTHRPRGELSKSLPAHWIYNPYAHWSLPHEPRDHASPRLDSDRREGAAVAEGPDDHLVV